MAKLTMLRGLPGSGKSTWARQEGLVIVNKDTIRRHLEETGWVWSKENERDVLKERNTQIITALKRGFDTISDDTNFAPKHEDTLRAIARQCGADFEIKEFDTSVEECIERNHKREGKARVPTKVITDMATQYMGYKIPDPLQSVVKYTPKENNPEAIIVDLDGTVCLHYGRSPYDTSLCFMDKPNQPIVDIVLMCDTLNINVLFVSGREEKYRMLSRNWLDQYIGADVGEALWMRPTGDTRNDAIVKLEIFNREIRDVYNVRFVLDDRDRVVKMWRSLGLTCLQVAEGDF